MQQVGAAPLGGKLLPGVVGRQVELAGAAGMLMRLRMLISHSLLARARRRLARDLVEAGEGAVDAAHHLVEALSGDRRVAAVAGQLLAVLLELP
jgi:hypothetical protein